MAKTRIPLIKTDTQAQERAEKLEMSTAEIGLTVRTTNCLEERGIFTVQDLLNCTPGDLLAISNFGEKTWVQFPEASSEGPPTSPSNPGKPEVLSPRSGTKLLRS